MNASPEKSGIIVCLNIGSSSLKFSLYSLASAALTEIGSGTIGSRETSPQLSFDYVHQDRKPLKKVPISGLITTSLRELALAEGEIIAIGHRLVHGGLTILEHLVLSKTVVATLRRAVPFAPLHLPPSLDLIDECFETFPGTPQVGCLDTAFHRTLPALAATLPLPTQIRDSGIRRFGFHGLSCESVLEQLRNAPVRRLVVAHLGGGCSITAILNGQSVDTSMGLTPMGGVVMSRRTGDLDPGIIFYLMREQRYDVNTLEDLFEHRSGLAGISKSDGDLRDLQSASDRGDADAALALDIFSHSVAKQIAGMCIALGAIDVLVFTGGVGENAGVVRERVTQLIGALELSLSILVLPARENERIAFHVANLI
ncbi:acetate kinase [Rhodanobacter sp. ANJX3]|uniref:acetate/propionate family kinase n=1 Tax=unclassified Rhodanobacter TaxID=2621553 RepID=UPI0015CBB93D|nr:MULTISPECIES: acetate kinase [unclassified Rhodanobacter]MBB5357080.1 acetate kinase [Rhodanobacter sp. ANJX3]NYE27151.1 acetate kinase [Rhodanobacter sp. K2T2]